MDIDFRWGGDPSIILAVEAALVASIPIQVCTAIALWSTCDVLSILLNYMNVGQQMCWLLIVTRS